MSITAEELTELTEMPNSSFDKDEEKFIIYNNNEKISKEANWALGLGITAGVIGVAALGIGCYNLHKAKKQKKHYPQMISYPQLQMGPQQIGQQMQQGGPIYTSPVQQMQQGPQQMGQQMQQGGPIYTPPVQQQQMQQGQGPIYSAPQQQFNKKLAYIGSDNNFYDANTGSIILNPIKDNNGFIIDPADGAVLYTSEGVPFSMP